jgi:hypothetical protein
MNVSSCRNSVMPPNTVITTRLTHSMPSTLRPRINTHPIWTKVATMATAVAM